MGNFLILMNTAKVLSELVDFTRAGLRHFPHLGLKRCLYEFDTCEWTASDYRTALFHSSCPLGPLLETRDTNSVLCIHGPRTHTRLFQGWFAELSEVSGVWGVSSASVLRLGLTIFSRKMQP
jgi:hypothetical protein